MFLKSEGLLQELFLLVELNRCLIRSPLPEFLGPECFMITSSKMQAIVAVQLA